MAIPARLEDRPVLLTRRLRLRRPERGDIDAIVAIAGDWEVARQLARMPHPYGRADAEHFLDEIVPNEDVWAVTDRATGALLGITGLKPAPEGRIAELGFYIGRHYWGVGVATEAAREMVAHAFKALGYAALTSGYFEDNPASGRVLAKLGFVEAARGERPCRAEGVTKPSIEVVLASSR